MISQRIPYLREKSLVDNEKVDAVMDIVIMNDVLDKLMDLQIRANDPTTK